MPWLPASTKSLGLLYPRASVLFHDPRSGMTPKWGFGGSNASGGHWPFTGVSWALRARNPEKSLKKVSRGLRPREPPESLEKVSKKSGESGKSLEKVPKDFFERLFPDSRGVPGPEAPGDFFQTFSGFRARRARETPVNGQRVPKAMLPLGALCFYQAHFGRTVLPKWPLWAHLFYSLVYSASELRRACFRHARVARAVLPPGALFRAGAVALPPCAPNSHMCPLPHLGAFRNNGSSARITRIV